MSAHPGGALLLEPRSCDTGPGVFFLCPILSFLLPMTPSASFHLTILSFLLIGFFIFSRLGSSPGRSFGTTYSSWSPSHDSGDGLRVDPSRGPHQKKWASTPLSSSIFYRKTVWLESRKSPGQRGAREYHDSGGENHNFLEFRMVVSSPTYAEISSISSGYRQQMGAFNVRAHLPGFACV